MGRSAFDVVALAKTINRRREEYNRAHPDGPAPITPAMSRILENDDEYIPYRTRKAKRSRRYASVDPAISTLIEIAASLKTTVGDLLGEPAYRITIADRRRLRELVRYLITLFELDSREL
ncbi:MAG: hypothetical protein ACREMY_10655 [bacterium]